VKATAIKLPLEFALLLIALYPCVKRKIAAAYLLAHQKIAYPMGGQDLAKVDAWLAEKGIE
jgi:hypothetical protein